MNKFVTGVLVTVGVIMLMGWSVTKGEENARKQAIDMLETEGNVEKVIEKLKEEA